MVVLAQVTSVWGTTSWIAMEYDGMQGVSQLQGVSQSYFVGWFMLPHLI